MKDSIWGILFTHPILIGVVLIALAAIVLRKRMRSHRAECKEISSDSGMTGGTVAEAILREEGIYDVAVTCMELKQGDHYNPMDKTIYLCPETYYGATIYDLASAAHQCGHAVQHKEDYCSMTVRFILVPVLSVISFLGLPLMIIGIVNGCNVETIQVASVMLVGVTFFQLISLPIELNASDRAMMALAKYHLMPPYEWEYCKKALSGAAYTYLATNAMTTDVVMRLLGGGR